MYAIKGNIMEEVSLKKQKKQQNLTYYQINKIKVNSFNANSSLNWKFDDVTGAATLLAECQKLSWHFNHVTNWQESYDYASCYTIVQINVW